tara:strand:+ start:11505 stop:11726 length:222 start_codon:yes stop_codon:yes gene_type:complete
MIQKGKATLNSGQDSIQINFSETFSSNPVVNISCKEDVNIYLLDVSKTYITVEVSNPLSSDLEINYVAIEKTS